MADLPPVFDGHTDTILDLADPDRGENRSFFERSEIGHVDFPRAVEAGYAGGLFAMFVPNENPDYTVERTDDGYRIPYADPVDPDRAKRLTLDMIDLLERLERASTGDFRVATSVAEIEAAMESGTLAAVPHIEGAAAVDPDLSNLQDLYEAGIRSIGLTWSRPNEFGYGVPFRYPADPDTGPGLTEAGRDLVRACDEYGILIDLAHLNEAGFWDVAEIATSPLVVSHAGVHGISPTTRNLTDEQLDAIGDSGGLVGVQFGVENLRPDGENDPETPISVIVDHVASVADRIGVEHVALGSDFDGCTVPDSVGDVTGLPAVLRALRERGFDGRDLESIAYRNWLRILDNVWN